MLVGRRCPRAVGSVQLIGGTRHACVPLIRMALAALTTCVSEQGASHLVYDRCREAEQLVVVFRRHRMSNRDDRSIAGRTDGRRERIDNPPERLGDDQRRGDALRFDLDGVVQTARRTGASITDAGEHQSAARRDGRCLRRVDRLSGALFAVYLDLQLGQSAAQLVGDVRQQKIGRASCRERVYVLV